MDAQRPDNKVQLGCGTLIVIALIVLFLSGGQDTKRLRSDVQNLTRKVERLEKKLDELSKKLDDKSPAATPAGKDE